MKKFRYDVIKDYKFYDIFTPVVILISKVGYKINFIDRENIPAEGRYILAVNHLSALDPFVAAIAVYPRGVHFMSKKELFGNSFTQWFFTNMNSFPIERGTGDRKAIKHSVKLLEAGKVLGIFPEGTRSLTGEPGKPKNGTVYLALKTKSDILPASVYYDKSRKIPVKVNVRYGKVIKFEDLGLPEKPSKEQLAKASEYVMDRINELYFLDYKK